MCVGRGGREGESSRRQGRQHRIAILVRDGLRAASGARAGQGLALPPLFASLLASSPPLQSHSLHPVSTPRSSQSSIDAHFPTRSSASSQTGRHGLLLLEVDTLTSCIVDYVSARLRQSLFLGKHHEPAGIHSAAGTLHSARLFFPLGCTSTT